MEQNGKILGFLVTREGELDRLDPSVVATQMAQHLQNAVTFREDSRAYAERSRVDKRKAAELYRLAERVEERRRGDTVGTSRMDPLDCYDPGALRSQANQHEQQSVRFLAESQTYQGRSIKEDRKAREHQVLIGRIRDRKAQRNAEVDAEIARIIRASRVK